MIRQSYSQVPRLPLQREHLTDRFLSGIDNALVAKICKRALYESFCWILYSPRKAANFCHQLPLAMFKSITVLIVQPLRIRCSSRSGKVPLLLLISALGHIFALIFMLPLGWNLNQCQENILNPFPCFKLTLCLMWNFIFLKHSSDSLTNLTFQINAILIFQEPTFDEIIRSCLTLLCPLEYFHNFFKMLWNLTFLVSCNN